MHSSSLRQRTAATLSLLGLATLLEPGARAAADELAPSTGVRADSSGGGEYAMPEPRDQMTPQQREQIQTEIRHNTRRLQQAGLLPPASPLLATSLSWPLRMSGISDPGVHGIGNYVDHNAS
jgi:hypothetical protein